MGTGMQPSPAKNERRILVLELGFFLLILLAPFVFGSVPLMVRMILSALFFLLLALFPEAIQKVAVLPFTVKIGFLALFLFLVVQFCFASVNRYATGIELLAWSSLAIGFLLIQLLPESTLKRLLMAAALVGVLEAVYGLYETFSGHESVLWRSKIFHREFVTGTYLNRNHLAGLLEMALGIQFGFLIKAILFRHGLKAFLWSIVAMATLAAFAGTASRMGFLSFLIASLIALFILFFSLTRFFAKNRSEVFSLLIFLAVFSVLLTTVAWFGRDMIALRLKNWQEGMDSLQGRWLAWQNLLRMILERRWFGTGLGTFEWAFPEYQSEKLMMGWAHAHNDYLELTATLGLVGAAILFISFAFLWIKTLKLLLRSPSQAFSPLSWGISWGTNSFLLHGFGDFNFSIPANITWLIILWAIQYRLLQISSGETL